MLLGKSFLSDRSETLEKRQQESLVLCSAPFGSN